MDTLKEYCLLKTMSDEQRIKYIKHYVLDLDPANFIMDVKILIDILTMINKEEKATTGKEDQKIKGNEVGASDLCRIIPLFPKDPRFQR